MSKDQENFRDTIGTINEEGKRAWVFPKKPSGKFWKYRTYVSYFLLAFLISMSSNPPKNSSSEETLHKLSLLFLL